ncbi:unnamed protein product [Penicillium manginii]
MAIYRPIPAKGEDRSYLAFSEFQFTANDPTVKGTRSNRVPVENCRLSDIKVEEKVTDRLETLKALQEKLKQLPGNASFYDLMAAICEILGVHCPEIRYELVGRNHNDTAQGRAASHSRRETLPFSISAVFDDSDPFLSRASPIFLLNVNQMGANQAESLGFKKVILYLLNMMRQDANLERKDPEYIEDLRVLQDLEHEVELQIERSI